jgi:hypothetical protein
MLGSPRQMNIQLERARQRDLLRPADNVFFGVVVEIAVVKRRWVRQVEQLLQLAEVDFDTGVGARRSCVFVAAPAP